MGGLLYSAILDSNTTLIDKLLGNGFDINRYAFGSLDGEGGGLRATIFTSSSDDKLSYEYWEDKSGASQQIKDSLDWHGYTPLLFAISQNQPGVVRHLIHRGADVQKPNQPVKVILWDEGVKLKTDHTVVRVPFTFGRTIRPLQLAMKNNNNEIIKILQAAGAR